MGIFDIFKKEKKQSLFELKHHYLKENTEFAAKQFLSSLRKLGLLFQAEFKKREIHFRFYQIS